MMKLAAAHEPPGDVRRLQFATFRRRMGSEITGDCYEDMPAFVGVAPLAELSHAGVHHLVGMEPCVPREKALAPTSMLIGKRPTTSSPMPMPSIRC